MRKNPKSFAGWFPILFVPVICMLAFFWWLISVNRRLTSPVGIETETPTQEIGTPTASQTAELPAPEATGTPTPEPTASGPQPLPQESRGLITNGSRTDHKIALTFDVCQAEGELSGYDAGIVKILTETNTPATFFLGGEWIRDHESEARELANNPLFQLGNHSWSHADFSKISAEQMAQEIGLAQDMLAKLTGRQNNLFRLPYGFYNDEALKMLGDDGLYTIQWEVVSGDPDPNIDAAAMTPWVLQQVQSGSIIIMHANGRGWHTAEALPGIIKTLRERGYTLVTISELLNIPRP
jgi:peptidoglycan/xylan/chitin deacetylase (PgdA/CDA1 family)